MSRGPNRLRAMAGALLNAVTTPRLLVRPADPQKILVLHELLLGDTLMLAALLAALRRRYASAEIFVTANPAHASLFSGKPYGVRVLPFSERNANAIDALSPASDCDLAILPGENRYAVVARAIGARWIAGFTEGRPGWRNRVIDESLPLPPEPMALADMFALLCGADAENSDPLRYRAGDWPAPDCEAFDKPEGPYAVLHVGAGSPLRLWEPSKWRSVARAIAAQGVRVVWTSGRNETDLVNEIDPDVQYHSLAGQLDLAQLWHLLAGARVAVTLDTGIAHMAKLTRTPVAALFGQGSAVLFGRGRFWENAPFAEVTVAQFPCRDQRHLFKREIDWVRRCNRTLAGCPRARCMEAISPEQVLAALQVQ